MTIYLEDKGELGIFRENNKLYAGYIFNSGVSKEWSIDYDDSRSFDDNLECLIEWIKQYGNRC